MNRLLIISFVLLISCSQRITQTFPSYYKKDPTVLTHPFQVLYADGVTNERMGVPIENKELLAEWQKLKISDEGILVLAHHTGAFTEVKGDTVVYVSDILESVESRPQKIDSTEMNYRIDTDILFIDSFEKYMVSGVVSYCTPSRPIQLCFPKEIGLPANVDKLCISWLLIDSVQSGIYEVIIYNIFDEVIFKTKVEGNSMEVNFNSFRYDMGLYIVEVRDALDEEFNSDKVGIVQQTESYFFPALCANDDPAQALELALYSELNFDYWRYKNEILLNYYQRAADLSGHPFYNKMLENFRKRIGME